MGNEKIDKHINKYFQMMVSTMKNIKEIKGLESDGEEQIYGIYENFLHLCNA